MVFISFLKYFNECSWGLFAFLYLDFYFISVYLSGFSGVFICKDVKNVNKRIK